MFTFLPYHTTPLFLNLLSILPEDLTPTFKVLYPYKTSLINPPRHPLVHSAATNKLFFSALNDYVLNVCRQQAHSHALLSFWAGIVTEAVAAMLDAARSGRREAEKQKHDDIIMRVLPILSSAFTMKKVSELIISCYMICVVLAQKSSLTDDVLDGLMESVVGSWNEETRSSGLICLAVLAQQRSSTIVSKKVFKAIIRLDNPIKYLSEVATQYQTSNLLLGLVAGCLNDLDKQKDATRLELLSSIFDQKFLGEDDTKKAMALIIEAGSKVDETRGMSLNIQTQLAELVQEFSRSESLQPLFQQTLAESSFSIPALEHNLQTVVEAPIAPPAVEDVEVEEGDNDQDEDTFTPALESLSKETPFPSSFLSRQSIPEFDKVVQLFALAADSEDRLELFTDLPILGRADATKTPQFLSFFTRVFSGPYPIGTKAAALKIIGSTLASVPDDFDPQALLPFLLVALADPSERVRRETTAVIARVGSLYKKNKKTDDHASNPWANDAVYGWAKQPTSICWLSTRDAHKILERAVLPGLEECILDSSHITKVLDAALRGSVLPDVSGASELKKSFRLSLFTFLCSHVISMPVFAPKLGLLRLLSNVDKVSGTTRTKELLPLLEIWRGLSQKEVDEICAKERLSVSELDQQIAAIVTPKDKDAINILHSSVGSSPATPRTSFVTAVFARIKEVWTKIPEDRQLAASEKLLDVSLGLSTDDTRLSNSCRDLLRSVELPGAVLVNFIQKIPVSLTDIDALGPAPKRRRTSQNNMVAMTVKDEAELSKLMDKMTFILEIVDSSCAEAHPELADGLFQTLASLHHFKSQIHSGMSYLLSLTLGSLLAIVNKSKVRIFATRIVEISDHLQSGIGEATI